MLAFIELGFSIIGGIFIAGLLLGLLIQHMRLNKALSKKRRAEQEMLKMQAQMLGMDDAYEHRKK